MTAKITQRTRDEQERQRVDELMRHWGSSAVFVFGSNRAGVHGAGAAAYAVKHYGARPRQGEGRHHRSYAIPTKATWRDDGLPLEEIAVSVARFVRYAVDHPFDVFVVTRIGCGFAGHAESDIAPLFRDAPANCHLPPGWREMGGAS